MIRTVKIENFKSVRELEIELGRVTVLIGANGAGKSNVLEGVAFGSAAASDRLDNEFLVSRGIRVPETHVLMASAFEGGKGVLSIRLTVEFEKEISAIFSASSSNSSYASWLTSFVGDFDLQRDLNNIKLKQPSDSLPLQRFLIYSPENRELRTFAEEGQILPLGIRGEGLFRLLKILSQQEDGAKLKILKEKLQLIDWFEDFDFQQDAMAFERRLMIRDRHLSEDLAYFDQRSANEGFLFLLFYFCLFLSDATPPFFAIDNIDSSLNPKLCEQLVRELVQMAKDNDKQAILTTHNPAVLDGLDLTDSEQKLYVVRRNLDGETIVTRVCAPEAREGQPPVPLSEAFLRGYLGGLPDNF